MQVARLMQQVQLRIKILISIRSLNLLRNIRMKNLKRESKKFLGKRIRLKLMFNRNSSPRNVRHGHQHWLLLVVVQSENQNELYSSDT